MDVRFTLQGYVRDCLPTFPVRHLHRPGAVERIRVKVWKARRENGPCLSIDIASTKGYRDQDRDMENWDSDSSSSKWVKMSWNHDFKPPHKKKREQEAWETVFHAAFLVGFHLSSEASTSLSPEYSTVMSAVRWLNFYTLLPMCITVVTYRMMS